MAAVLVAMGLLAVGLVACSGDEATPTAAVSANPPLTIDSPIGDLLKDPEASAILEKHFGPQYRQLGAVQSMTLEKVVPMSGGRLTEAMVAAIAADLAALNR